MKFPIYFDHNATTPCLPEVLEAMTPYFTSLYGNASSSHHVYGWLAEEAVEIAREQVAHLIRAAPKEIVFTSGATESVNLAIRGVGNANLDRGKHFVTLSTEHKAVLDTLADLRQEGFEVTVLPVDGDGLVDLNQLEEAIRDDTVMVAAMFANNETGVLQPIQEIADLTRSKGVLLLSDSVQAVGKMPLNVRELNVDLVPLSAHKFYGPKGVGALYIRKSQPGVYLKACITGGGQELGRRSGTLNIPGIVGLGKAAEIASREMDRDRLRLKPLRDKLENALLALDGCRLNGHPVHRLPHVSNISFAGVNGKDWLIRINKELAVSSGSACSSITDKPSHVLKAMGLENELAKSTLRFGLGKSTTDEQVDFAIEFVKESYRQMTGDAASK
ncbi:cysteine desulfurase family protein [Negadavirga shengliensis]|uniref:cysteine desulfurase n=1 Tax=Negadavirga shengliensis TaxID=1389218 RepID=A0ABV9T676_9BACT